MKLGIARIYTNNADIKDNYNRLLNIYKEALSKNIDFIIFPRLTLTGFSIYDNYANSTEESLEFFEKIIDITNNKKTAILIGQSYEDIYDNHVTSYDSAFFLENGCINDVVCRKNIDKNNIFNDYKYFDKYSYIKFFNYKNKKFSVLISDDIYSNNNLFLVRENRPDYIICLDSTVENDINKKLVKMSEVIGVPVFYINSATYYKGMFFSGKMTLVNEEAEIFVENFYTNDEIFDFEIDCEDGTELFVKNREKQQLDIRSILEKYFKNKKIIICTDKFAYNPRYKNCKFISFDDENFNDNVEKIELSNYINLDLYNKLQKEEQNVIKEKIMELL